MLTFIGRRLLQVVPLLFVVSILVFLLLSTLDFDIARAKAGLTGTDEQVAAIEAELHLDEPLYEQYGRWIWGCLHGDFGESWYDKGEVGPEMANRVPITASIVVPAFFLSVLVGLPMGVLAAVRAGRPLDRFITFLSSIGISTPEFWLASMLIAWFAVTDNLPFVGRLPAGGYVHPSESLAEWARHLVLPWIATGATGAASIARQVRANVIDALDQDYIRTANAKGLPRRSVVYKHALKNASLPVITVLGIGLAYAFGGSIVLERIFSINGIGQYVNLAISGQDRPIIQAFVLLAATLFITINLFVDVMYGVLNPKVRLT